ncbi:cilia- and flagella-associated protein 36 [Plutella xylostella]|uniref:cilia- and flagella-associated protein 36 n=1 Tax=Plutella xylostella TaxID=51655 RepID=UPI00203256A4|nr:cilia- and flagella-associated protein 36 [Plutella xylostella]
MAGSESSGWVFDSLVGFLHGPVWNDPLQSFIEEKSLPFEPADNGEVQHRPEYKKIHEEYKDLVDVMLSTFMEDIGITSEQFESACRMSARDLAGLPAHFHRRLFDQIWAANDYDIFVKMMTHKNVELQLQALELIERRFGARPALFSDDAEPSPRSDDSGDWSDQVMKEVKQLSLEEPSDENQVDVPPEMVVEEKQSLLLKLQSFDKNEERKAEAKKQEEAQTAIEESPVEDVEEAADEIVVKPPAAKVKAPPPPVPVVLPVLKKVELVSEDEVRARQEYLKQQRDKLLALKKRVRERRLGAAQEEDEGDAGGEGEASKPARPRSARVAAAALAGSAPRPPPDAMSLRRALATQLKTEVVDTQH